MFSRGFEVCAIRWFEVGSNKEAEAVVDICGEFYGYSEEGEFLYPLVKVYK